MMHKHIDTLSSFDLQMARIQNAARRTSQILGQPEDEMPTLVMFRGTCNHCNGRGRFGDAVCEHCSGHGEVLVAP